jgi:hypothetical protein
LAAAARPTIDDDEDTALDEHGQNLREAIPATADRSRSTVGPLLP